jgi:phosphoribosylglycinamide formyltransferase 1
MSIVVIFATMPSRIAILASGDGSNAENIIRHFKGNPDISIVMVLSNNPDAFVLKRAAQLKIPAHVFTRQQLRETGEVLGWLQRERVTHIVLAGFLWLVPAQMLELYRERIINIHPALLPRHGGKGMYGSRVHEAVKASGDNETGITIHLVDPRYDEGKIIFQQNCPVSDSDSVEDITNKVRALEQKHYPRVIEDWVHRTQASTA